MSCKAAWTPIRAQLCHYASAKIQKEYEITKSIVDFFIFIVHTGGTDGTWYKWYIRKIEKRGRRGN